MKIMVQFEGEAIHEVGDRGTLGDREPVKWLDPSFPSV